MFTTAGATAFATSVKSLTGGVETTGGAMDLADPNACGTVIA
jgi:hypothetical protein